MFGKLARLFGMLEKASRPNSSQAEKIKFVDRMPTITCDNCGKVKKGHFYKDIIDSPGKKFCTRSCRSKYNTITFKCDQCGKQKTVHPHRSRFHGHSKKFCTKRCADSYKGITIKCHRCNRSHTANVFYEDPDDSSLKFCGYPCIEKYIFKKNDL